MRIFCTSRGGEKKKRNNDDNKYIQSINSR